MMIKKIIYFTVILLPVFIGYAVQAKAAVQHKALYKHAKTLLLARSNSGQFSNANNFKSAMQSSVDPRTGTLSCSMVVGQLHSNWGKGPFYKLALSYTSGSSANPDGIGHGWQWNLSHYNVNTHSLTTDQGRTFLLVKKADGTWGLRYHKIKDIVLTGSPQTGLIVTLKTGVREYFSPEGYVTKIESEMGEWITFHYMYEGNKALLTRISDEKGRNIQIKHADGMIYVSSLNDTGQFSTITITTSNNKVHRIILPSPTSSIPAIKTKKINHSNYAIRFSYDHNFLTKINYPTGAENDYLYSFQTGAKEVFKLLVNGKTYSAPVVIEHIQKPNAGTMQGARIITYKYGSASLNHHDYLAFGSVKPAIPSSNHDVLFDTRASYTYRTIVDNGQTKNVRIYNKYHLMIKEVKINDQTNQRLSETQHYYCDPNDLNACDHLTFAQLPSAYVLPLKVVQKVWSSLKPAAKPMVLISKATYDNEGNTVRMTDHYGRMSQITYCPIKGDASCPASPAGWPFVNLIESTVYDGLGRPIAMYIQAAHKGHLLPVTNENGTTRADGWQLLITNAYDAYGHLVDIKKHAGLDGQGDPIVLDTHKYYSTSGVLTRVTHTDGTAVHYVYAENELCAARYRTDREGHINQVAIANFNQIKKMIRNVTYPEGVVVPNSNNIEKLCQLGYNADHKGLVSTYLYDSFGRSSDSKFGELFYDSMDILVF